MRTSGAHWLHSDLGWLAAQAGTLQPRQLGSRLRTAGISVSPISEGLTRRRIGSSSFAGCVLSVDGRSPLSRTLRDGQALQSDGRRLRVWRSPPVSARSPRAMRVLMVANSGGVMGGHSVQAGNTAQALRELGADVTLKEGIDRAGDRAYDIVHTFGASNQVVRAGRRASASRRSYAYLVEREYLTTGGRPPRLSHGLEFAARIAFSAARRGMPRDRTAPEAALRCCRPGLRGRRSASPQLAGRSPPDTGRPRR